MKKQTEPRRPDSPISQQVPQRVHEMTTERKTAASIQSVEEIVRADPQAEDNGPANPHATSVLPPPVPAGAEGDRDTSEGAVQRRVAILPPQAPTMSGGASGVL